MDTTTTYDIRHRLHLYDTAVQETRDHALERSSFGRYRACTVFCTVSPA